MCLQLVSVLCGALIGGTAAYALALFIQLQEGKAELDRYADRLLLTGRGLAKETDKAVAAVRDDHLPFCSDAEIAFMRDFVYGAAHVKTIGRGKDGRLYCSTNLGRLENPASLPAPDISESDTFLFVDLPSMMSSRSAGFVTETGGVAIALNPELYKSLDEPPLSYSGLFHSWTSDHVLHAFGHAMPLAPEEIVAGHLLERDGVLYQPRCASRAMLCVVAAESRRDVLTGDVALLPVFLISGGGLGASLALILTLIYERERSLERQLRRAIRRGALTFVYQPVVDLTTGAIVGAEALARWRKGDGEAVRPDVFIALAEERGFVGEITRFVIRRALSDLADLLVDGAFKLTLNITAPDLADPEFSAFLDESITAAGISASRVGLELTERSTADQQGAIEAIARQKAAGHTVYIDDFGTGYSSLSYLHRLTADVIKIDRAFTQTIGTEAVTASVVPLILEIARQLQLLVVVEGIETAEQAAYFRTARDGTLGQGWLFGKPVPAAELRTILAGGARIC